MGLIKKFIIGEFSKNFIMVFLPFLSILSIIYVIRIASFSQRINVSSKEMFNLFILFLPDILFYTIPISFIVALSATLLKLSNDNELIALFSYGLSPKRILSFFSIPAILFSTLLLLLSMIIIPKSTYDFKILKAKKIADAQLTVESNKLGQKFGDFIFFAGKKDKDKLQDVVLFTQTKHNKKIIFMAKEGKITNKDGIFQLDLLNGSGDTFLPTNVKSLKYSKMSIFHYLKNRRSKAKIEGWSNIGKNKKLMSKFTYNIFISFSPLLSILLAAGLSIINPRYQKSSIYLVSALILILIYTLGSILKNSGTIGLLFVSVVSLVLAGYLTYKKRVMSTF